MKNDRLVAGNQVFLLRDDFGEGSKRAKMDSIFQAAENEVFFIFG